MKLSVSKPKIQFLPFRELMNAHSSLDGIRELRKREISREVIRAVNRWMYSQDQ